MAEANYAHCLNVLTDALNQAKRHASGDFVGTLVWMIGKVADERGKMGYGWEQLPAREQVPHAEPDLEDDVDEVPDVPTSLFDR